MAATEKFLARLGSGFRGTVWVGGSKNWYTSRQPTPVLWLFPQSEHKAFLSMQASYKNSEPEELDTWDRAAPSAAAPSGQPRINLTARRK